jgi:hypothetical protein
LVHRIRGGDETGFVHHRLGAFAKADDQLHLTRLEQPLGNGSDVFRVC